MSNKLDTSRAVTLQMNRLGSSSNEQTRASKEAEPLFSAEGVMLVTPPHVAPQYKPPGQGRGSLEEPAVDIGVHPHRGRW